MRRRLLLLLCLALMAGIVWQARRSQDKLASLLTRTSQPSTEDRVTPARARSGEKIAQQCRNQGVSYPPRELFLRAFKAERELEAWARSDDGAFHLTTTWPVLAASGEPGPKRREGDRQVPEGCYRVIVFNPLSNFHLSLGLDYPNASDRIRSDSQQPGSDIYIHGGAFSIGCLALGDDSVEELYLLARDTREQPIHVHIFPARMAGSTWETLRAQHPKHAAFWAELAPIYSAFEDTRKVPVISIDADGSYRIR